MKYIDFHTHIFPDRIAQQALASLAEDSGDYKPRTDGTLNGLVASMDNAGISMSVVANIATKPTQIRPILDFCRHIQSERIASTVSFHPDNTLDEVEALFTSAAELGIRGVKLHPMYQGFFIDDKKMFKFYQFIEHFGFFLIFHTGFDIAFPGNDQADVERVKIVAEQFKDLTIITTHVGGWKQWDRAKVLRKLDNVYTETSMTLPEMDDKQFVKLLSRFDENRVLFGTDSPWTDQKEMLERTLQLKLSEKFREKLLYQNAAHLLGKKG